METNIWEIKSYEDDPDGYFWQVEWDIEYVQFLNIVYHLNDLEEINDVYRLVWILWLTRIYDRGMHFEAEIIWENLLEWKLKMNLLLK